MIDSFLNWFAEFGASNTAVMIMFANAVGESIIFPVPCDLILMALATIAPHNAIYYAAITVIGSVLGAMVGYLIGLKGGRKVLERFFAQEKLTKLDRLFERYGVWAIFVAGFTPIPYKVFTIASGVAKFNFTSFVLVSILSRGLRFFAIGLLFFLYGAEIRDLLDQYLGLISWGALVLFVIAFVIYLFINARKRKRAGQV